jgi:hypothetical protein
MRRKEEVLTMLIFNDLVIVAVDTSERTGLFSGKRKADKGLKVLCELEGGVGKVVEVKDWSGWQGESLCGIGHTGSELIQFS